MHHRGPHEGRGSSRSEDGASAVEYGLLVAGIAGVVVAIIFLLGGTVRDLFEGTCDTVVTGSGGQMSASC
ncbi:MAG TPA: Flp family type IVb pilin [Propionicimonas sp.]|nr:Flp family type IVb pilin [Propionicimonas sp.]